jgi:hypothetical protein
MNLITFELARAEGDRHVPLMLSVRELFRRSRFGVPGKS